MNQSIEILKQLIKIKSYSRNEAEIQEYIFKWLENEKLKPIKQGENVVVKIKGEDSSKALIFNAHVDTVEMGSLKSWQTEPLELTVKQGKGYGLGASDEKAGVASLMLLGSKLSKQKPEVDTWLTFVVKEEIDGSGTKSFLDWFVSKGYIKAYIDISAILVEPSYLREVELGHKGNIFVKIVTKGKSGHGSKPINKKDHAVWQMFEVMKKLDILSVKWKKEYQDAVLGEPTMAIPTSIKSGSEQCVNKIGESCSMTVDIRTTPKLHHLVVKKLKQELKGLAQVELMGEPAPWGLTQKEAKIVKVVKKVVKKVKLSLSQGSNDLCFFTQHNISAVVIGPGEKSCIHQANEYVKLEKIAKAVEIYEKIIKEYY